MGRKKKTQTVLESATSHVQAITPRFDPIMYTAIESDTYARIAAEFLPPGYTKHKYAVHLAEKNKNKPISKGTVIEL